MSESIKIQIYTQKADAKQPLEDATVGLVTRAASETDDDKKWPFFKLAATHEHRADGFYVAKVAGSIEPGEFLLVVRQADSSPVVQRLTLVAKRGVLEVEAGWGRKKGAAFQAATVSIVNVGPPGAAARFLDPVPVFAAPPGMGSLYLLRAEPDGAPRADLGHAA